MLEYNSPVWSPWLISDIKCIECVQQFFTRAISKRASVSVMSYADRLLNLGLQSLKYCRIFLDLDLCYKIIYQLVDLKHDDFFQYLVTFFNAWSCINTSVYPTVHAGIIYLFPLLTSAPLTNKSMYHCKFQSTTQL